MSFLFTPAKTLLLQGGLDFREAGSDIRAILVMGNSTAAAQEDSTFVSDITTLDEYDGSGYARAQLASQVVNEDTANNRAAFDATDYTWSTIGAGTRQIVGMILYKHTGADTVNRLIGYINDGGFPCNGTGGNIVVTWNVLGILLAI